MSSIPSLYKINQQWATKIYTSMQLEVTRNEHEIVLAIRAMQPRDKMVVVKRSPKDTIELFVRIERGILLSKGDSKQSE